MKKQTAVEWLQGQFRAFGTMTDSDDERTHQLIKTAINMCEQAKAMDKVQDFYSKKDSEFYVSHWVNFNYCNEVIS